MATHTLSADTRMEDIAGLASGDTIQLSGHVLTCETDLSAITGLKATGVGTIRLLNGGFPDFSGAALSADITVEAGTESNPLPSSGSYLLSSAACIKVMASGVSANFSKIVSHAVGNANRVQFAKIESATSTSLKFDRDMDLKAGDSIGILYKLSQNNDPINPPIIVSAYDANTKTATIPTISLVPNSGSGCVLLTSSFCVTTPSGAVFPGFSGFHAVEGDEVGLFSDRYSRYVEWFASVKLKRLVAAGVNTSSYSFFGSSIIDVGTYVSTLGLANSSTSDISFTLFSGTIGRAFCPSLVCGWYNYGRGYEANAGCGVIVGGGYHSIYPWQPLGRMECVDCEEPSPLYQSIRPTTELVVRTTNPVSCNVYRDGGIATLKQRAELSPSIAIPDAWRLQPTTGTAWHDEPLVVQPGATLAVQWYACLLEGGATAGVQILDGENPLFGQVAVGMGVAYTLAEYTLPNDTPVEAWQPVKQLTWRNTTGDEKKVVLRGWASGGNAYSKITSVPGGVA